MINSCPYSPMYNAGIIQSNSSSITSVQNRSIMILDLLDGSVYTISLEQDPCKDIFNALDIEAIIDNFDNMDIFSDPYMRTYSNDILKKYSKQINGIYSIPLIKFMNFYSVCQKLKNPETIKIVNNCIKICKKISKHYDDISGLLMRVHVDPNEIYNVSSIGNMQPL